MERALPYLACGFVAAAVAVYLFSAQAAISDAVAWEIVVVAAAAGLVLGIATLLSPDARARWKTRRSAAKLRGRYGSLKASAVMAAAACGCAAFMVIDADTHASYRHRLFATLVEIHRSQMVTSWIKMAVFAGGLTLCVAAAIISAGLALMGESR